MSFSERKNLYLHIGHGKTGSSSLQTFLALNKDNLKEYGIFYPEHVSFSNAEKGFITSGNLTLDNNWVKYIDN